jgi:hypothetical protein
MPSYIEYWQTLSYSTCQQYKTYKNIIRFRKNLFKHATKNGVTLINSPGDNEYQNFISNIIKPRARRAAEDNGIAFRAKRVRLPKIEIAQAPVVVDNAMELQADAAIVPTIIIHEIEQQPMMQAQALIQEADIALIAQEQRAEQPMEQEQWAEQPMVDAALVQAQALIAPPSAHLPNANGVRRVVPTNTLVLNGIAIEVDPVTLMVNATQMCRAAGKLFGNYRRLDSTEDYLQVLSSDIHICISELVTKNLGGRGTSQDTNVHFLVALHLAYWLSIEVQVQFSKWIAELCIENAALSTQIEELKANAAIVPIAITPTPIFNGARKPLVLNGVTIEVDPMTFMVNATQMCRAAGKLYAHYSSTIEMTEFVKTLSSTIGIPIFDLVRSIPGHYGGTVVHRRVAMYLAQRISPVFNVQVTGYLDELLLTGRVELGNEMSTQQLEDVWKRRIEEGEAKASADVSAAQDLCREIILQKNELELQLATIQEAQQLTKAAQEELMAIKAREDLETTIQALVNNTAPTIASFKNGDNVLYLARIDETKFKYGHTKNIVQRFDAHMRIGVYPMFEPVGIFLCNNGVAAEDKVHAYVKKNKLKAEYGTQREIILLDNVDKLQRLIKMMQKCTTFMALTQSANDNTDVELRRIELEMKRIELLMECKITFEQYLQMK